MHALICPLAYTQPAAFRPRSWRRNALAMQCAQGGAAVQSQAESQPTSDAAKGVRPGWDIQAPLSHVFHSLQTTLTLLCASSAPRRACSAYRSCAASLPSPCPCWPITCPTPREPASRSRPASHGIWSPPHRRWSLPRRWASGLWLALPPPPPALMPHPWRWQVSTRPIAASAAGAEPLTVPGRRSKFLCLAWLPPTGPTSSTWTVTRTLRC